MKTQYKPLNTVQVKQLWVNMGGWGKNLEALLVIDGVEYRAIRQGGLRFWAFSARDKFSPTDQKTIDAACDVAAGRLE